MEVVEATTETAEQPKQIFDADNDKWIDNPLLKKEEKKADSEEETDETEVKKPTDKTKEKPVKEEKTEVEETEEEPEPEETEETEEESEEEDEPEAKSKKDENLMDPDEFFAHTYGEKYGIKTQAELDNLIENSIEMMDELETTKKERDQLREAAKAPKFTSDKQQKAFEFLSQYDLDRQGEALDSYAKLLTMDMESANPRMILEEAFVHRNLNKWSREEAQRMFSKEYSRKYALKRESFDGSDAEYEEELKDLKTLEKGEVADAKSYLKEQKTKYKPAEKEQPKQNENVSKAIEQNVARYNDFVEKKADVVFGEGENKFKFKLDKERKEQVSNAIKAWASNPAMYDDKGALRDSREPDDLLYSFVGALFPHELIKSAMDEASSQVALKRVDDLAKKQPKKRASNPGENRVNNDNLDEQAMQLIKKRQAA